ncbi:hypothetical protein RND81_12G207900 [Saponaria officinalis]
MIDGLPEQMIHDPQQVVENVAEPDPVDGLPPKLLGEGRVGGFNEPDPGTPRRGSEDVGQVQH